MIGFLAYLALLISIFKQSLTRKQVSRIRKCRTEDLPASARMGQEKAEILPDKRKSKEAVFSSSFKKGRRKPEDFYPWSRDNQQAILYIISISLFALFLTDGSAFSAGSILAAIFWISAAGAGALRAEAVVAERLSSRVEERGLMTDDRRVKRPQTADRRPATADLLKI
ncbi:MAG: hypothetical protein NTX30_23245 [Deltaproteobacteria bacterium]|nr:hypothetical protein [Deltaproteobacteria bacterium]